MRAIRSNLGLNVQSDDRAETLQDRVKTFERRRGGAVAVLVLAGVADSSDRESEQAKLAASKEILDRAYGRPTQTLASDPDAPLFPTEIIWTAVSPDASREVIKQERAMRRPLQPSPQSH